MTVRLCRFIRSMLAWGVLAVAGLHVHAARAQATILLRASAQNTAALGCRQALHDKANILAQPDLQLVDSDLYSEMPPSVSMALDLEAPREETAIALASVPFAFRDPAHFQAFLGSDLYRELRLTDQEEEYGHPWVALAYGGFYQLFSGKRAMTEPAHFEARYIGGAVHSMLYQRFHAIGNVYAMLTGGTVGTDADRMLENDNTMAAVEAPLIEASRFDLGHKARFLNLMFTAAAPIVFSAEGMNGLPSVVRSRVTRWAETAAQACSAANLQQEKTELETLKSQGVTVVPADRAAFVQAGWAYGMGLPNIAWSTSDFDRLVRIGREDAHDKVPSSIIPTLPAKQRAAFLAYSRKAEQTRRKINQTAGVRGRIETAWSEGIEVLADAVRETSMPAGSSPKYLSQFMRHLAPAKVSASDAQTMREQAVRQLAGTGESPCLTMCGQDTMQWVAAARLLLLEAGDAQGARQLLDAATRLSEQTEPKTQLPQLDAWDQRLMVLDGYMALHPDDLPAILSAARRRKPTQLRRACARIACGTSPRSP